MAFIFDSFFVNLGKDIDFSVDTLGVVLSDILPSVSADSIVGDIIELPNGNGYITGGPDVNIISWDATDVPYIAELVTTQPIFTANGGSIGPFRYAVLYDKTPGNRYLISCYDYGAEKTLADTEAIIISFDDGTNFGTLRLGIGNII